MTTLHKASPCRHGLISTLLIQTECWNTQGNTQNKGAGLLSVLFQQPIMMQILIGLLKSVKQRWHLQFISTDAVAFLFKLIHLIFTCQKQLWNQNASETLRLGYFQLNVDFINTTAKVIQAFDFFFPQYGISVVYSLKSNICRYVPGDCSPSVQCMIS